MYEPENMSDSLISQVREELARRSDSDDTDLDLKEWNQIIQSEMIRQQMTLATAESCTGGYIASRITDLQGSSGYFLGSVVSYSNEVKQNVLHVPPSIIQTHGAVSTQCAEAMLAGVLDLIGSDVGIAVTGIAGPGGGSAEKPVGTVFVSVGNKTRMNTVRLFCESHRKGVVEYTYQRSMYFLYRFLST